MIRREIGKSKQESQQVDDFTIQDMNGKIINLGDTIRVPPLRGKFVVKTLRANGDVGCYGGTANHRLWRTFKAERVVRVNGK